MNLRNVLLISYVFPPVGGARVQRVTKFVKYLPEHGWGASVLTAANPSVPVFDRSLLKDVPPGTEVCRAKTWEPGYRLKSKIANEAGVTTAAGGGRGGSLKRLLKRSVRRATNMVLHPDPQILWGPSAVRAGAKLLRAQRHDAIVASGPPFSTFIVGARLSQASGLPLVLDYRDEWSLANSYLENKQLDAFSRRVHTWMQDRLLRRASAVIATTRNSADALRQACQRAHSQAMVSHIYNGYDPDDLIPPATPQKCADGRFRLLYMGTLWNLTSIAPLVEAVQALDHQIGEQLLSLELVVVGRKTPAQHQLLEAIRSSTRCIVVEHDYVEHKTAIELLFSADALLVLLSDLAGANRVVPAKIFEYMASRRRVLGIMPRGEAWDLLRQYPGAVLCEPRDVAAISAEVAKMLRDDPAWSGEVNKWEASRFERRSQARQLADLLGELSPIGRVVPVGAC